MRKLIYTLFLVAAGLVAQAQSTAMDFSGDDCNGNPQHLFADLDAGNAVILEFFMLNCSPCVTAGNALEAMKTDILALYPGKVKSYSIGFTNVYTCPNIANWVSSHGYTSMPMDSGSAQLAYYGGFGMPTVVILGGGTAHSILGAPYIGFSTSDTTTMAADIRTFLGTATAVAAPVAFAEAQVSPQPADAAVRLQLDLRTAGDMDITLLDLSGKELMTVYEGSSSAGQWSTSIDTRALPAGLYLLRIAQGDAVLNQRFVVAH